MEVATFFEALESTVALVDRPEIATAWDGPSALEGYTVGGLAAHLRAAIERTVDAVTTPALDGAPLLTIAELYAPARLEDRADLAGGVPARLVATGNAAAAEEGAAAGVAAFATLPARLRPVLDGRPEDEVVAVPWVPGGATTLGRFLTTRALELVVHGDDLAASVGLVGEVAEPPAAVLQEVLDALVELAVARSGGLAVVRAFTRVERADPDVVRVL